MPSIMDVNELHALSFPFVLTLEDQGEITFHYRPFALAGDKGLEFQALDERPEVQARRILRAAQENGSDAESMALAVAQEEAAIEHEEGERLAKRLCLLLDPVPGKGHDLTHNGEALPVTPEVLRQYLKRDLLEAVTEGILIKVRNPRSYMTIIGTPPRTAATQSSV